MVTDSLGTDATVGPIQHKAAALAIVTAAILDKLLHPSDLIIIQSFTHHQGTPIEI